MDEKQLKKVISEEIKKVLQEDLGAGSNQSYEAPSKKIPDAINVLKEAYKRIQNPASACIGWHEGVKDAGKLIMGAIKILEEK